MEPFVTSKKKINFLNLKFERTNARTSQETDRLCAVVTPSMKIPVILKRSPITRRFSVQQVAATVLSLQVCKMIKKTGKDIRQFYHTKQFVAHHGDVRKIVP
jgi:hypothetical protein